VLWPECQTTHGTLLWYTFPWIVVLDRMCFVGSAHERSSIPLTLIDIPSHYQEYIKPMILSAHRVAIAGNLPHTFAVSLARQYTTACGAGTFAFVFAHSCRTHLLRPHARHSTLFTILVPHLRTLTPLHCSGLHRTFRQDVWWTERHIS
jgi:hypothetical protein